MEGDLLIIAGEKHPFIYTDVKEVLKMLPVDTYPNTATVRRSKHNAYKNLDGKCIKASC